MVGGGGSSDIVTAVKGAKQTPPNPHLALKDISKNLQLFHCGSLKNSNLMIVSKQQKVQSCFSFFALKRKFLKTHCIAEKFSSKIIFKE